MLTTKLMGLLPLMPLLLLAATVILVMLTTAFFRNHSTAFVMTLAGLSAALASLFFVHSSGSVTPLLLFDGYSAYYMGLIFVAAGVVTVLSYDYLRMRKETHANEYYLVLLLATLGSAVLTASNHFASFFLGLEILSVSLYVLISYRRNEPRSLEAGTKYLILAGVSSAFLLFGMALVYSSLGTMEFSRMGSELMKRSNTDVLTLIGTAMLLVGVGFKLSLAPFHMWAPDIYEGAPAPVSSFVATVSKGAMFALLFRFLITTGLHLNSDLIMIFTFLAIASMSIGNLTALRQNNVKRLLAYSSIAHLGYLLVALLAGATIGANAVGFYLMSYFVTTLLAFGVLCVLSHPDREADQISDYQGLFWQKPFLALVFSASILSLAGIPLTVGFLGKFYLITAGISHALWTLVVILVLNSAIGLYYYLRLIVAMFTPSVTHVTELPFAGIPSRSALVVLSGLVLWFGIYPSPMLHLIQNSMASLIK